MQVEAKKSYELQQLIENKDKEIEDLKASLNVSACDAKALEPSTESQQLPSLIPASTPSLPVTSSTKQSLSSDKIRKFHEENREKSPEISDPMIVTDDSDSDDQDQESDIPFNPNQSKESSKDKSKRKSRAEAKANAKKLMDIAFARLEPWKCEICSKFFKTNEALRLHITTNHQGRKICKRCPKNFGKQSDVRKHEQYHFRADLKKSCSNVHECKLCHVWFGNGRLVKHIYQFHMPIDEN